MRFLAGLLFAVSMIFVSSCASNKPFPVDRLEPEMTTDEVLARSGEPVTSEAREEYDAWRYEYRVPHPPGCNMGVAGEAAQSNPCRQVCEHATVWFADDQVQSVTMIRVDSVKECGSSGLAIDWSQQPDYAKGDGD